MSASNDNAELEAQKLAESVIRWFGFSDRRRIVWSTDYNQAARDLYERACRLAGRLPLPKDHRWDQPN